MDSMRHRVRFAAIALLMAAAAVSAQPAAAGSEIFRCVEEGRVTYSDRACGATSVLLPQSRDHAIADASLGDGVASPVELGMSPRSVQQAMGRPRETIATLEGSSLVEYWVWRRATTTTRVAFREGRVSRVDVR